MSKINRNSLFNDYSFYEKRKALFAVVLAVSLTIVTVCMYLEVFHEGNPFLAAKQSSVTANKNQEIITSGVIHDTLSEPRGIFDIPKNQQENYYFDSLSMKQNILVFRVPNFSKLNNSFQKIRVLKSQFKNVISLRQFSIKRSENLASFSSTDAEIYYLRC